jgi:hypothetical protein
MRRLGSAEPFKGFAAIVLVLAGAILLARALDDLLGVLGVY